MRTFLSKALLVFSTVCIIASAYLFWEREDPNRLSFDVNNQTIHVSPIAKRTSQPVFLLIPDLHIRLPIIPANLSNGNWVTTDQGVSYLTNSPIPGDMGNSILYGHDWASLLGSLPYIHPGEKIEILYADHTEKIFTVRYTAVVTPTAVDILKPSHDKRITIYTCTGFLDSKRFVAVAVTG